MKKKIWKKIEKKSEQILRKQNCCIFFRFLFFPKNYFLCSINGMKISPDSAQRGYK